jgi:hypothetical protein
LIRAETDEGLVCGAEYGDEILSVSVTAPHLKSGPPPTSSARSSPTLPHHEEAGRGWAGLPAEHVKISRRCAIKMAMPGIMADPKRLAGSTAKLPQLIRHPRLHH